ncbi:MAG: homoserine O-acetyltransferase, partial [Actinomycetes bacterium]
MSAYDCIDAMTTLPPDSTTRPPVTGAWRPGDPVGHRRFHTVTADRPFRTESGAVLDAVEVAFETWGTLDADASNAVLLCHALTGDSHAVGDSGLGHATPGWWNGLVGPGRAIDTNRWFVVCSNVLGGCQGTTGPSSIHPATGNPYGSAFPVVTIRDMVRVQRSLASALGVSTWHAVVGGSMGGMQALEWAVMYPDAVRNLIVCSTTAQASALQIAWSHIGRNAITEDLFFAGGDYYGAPEGPHRGLAVARKAAHVTYRSDESFTERFGRNLRERFEFTIDPVFDVEGYLDHQGDKLVRRFDANSYIVLNRAMD